MASPSNRKDGSTYLEKAFNKTQLIDRCLEQEQTILDLENTIKTLNNENTILKKNNEILIRKYDKLTTEDYVIKKILELRAKNYSPVIIRDKLKLQGIEKTLKNIKDIISSELTTELELYFSKCKQEYAESIKINTTYYHQSSIDEIQRLIDSAYEDLENCEEEDIIQRSKLRDSISNYISKRDTLMRNINETGEITEEEEEMNETFESYKNTSDKLILKLSSEDIKIIGDENAKFN